MREGFRVLGRFLCRTSGPITATSGVRTGTSGGAIVETSRATSGTSEATTAEGVGGEAHEWIVDEFVGSTIEGLSSPPNSSNPIPDSESESEEEEEGAGEGEDDDGRFEGPAASSELLERALRR